MAAQEEIYDPSWDGAQAEARPYAGLAGVGAQGRNILADTEGFFGLSIGKGTNAIFNVQPPVRAGGLIRGLVITISTQAQGVSEIITYDPTYVYERTYPDSTDITIATSGGQYEPTTQTIRIPPNTTQTITIALVFRQAFAQGARGVWA